MSRVEASVMLGAGAASKPDALPLEITESSFQAFKLIAAQVESLNQADTLYILDHARSGIGLYFLMPLAQGRHKMIR